MIQVCRNGINHCLTHDIEEILPDYIVLEKGGVAMLPGFWSYCGQQIAAFGKEGKCENGGNA